MTIRNQLLAFILLGLISGHASGHEQQLTLSTYFDSNPRENIEDKDPTVGVKAKGLLRFDRNNQYGRLYGSILGQGFLEPALFLDSKLVMNGEVGGDVEVTPGYRFYGYLKTFQKLYFDDLQRSGYYSLSVSLRRSRSPGMRQELGLRKTNHSLDYGTLFKYTSQSATFSLTRQFGPVFQAGFRAQIGQIDYADYPARSLSGDSLVLSDSKNQRDRTRLLGLQVKHLGIMIWGITVNLEDISSNSALEEAQVWSGKLFLSGRFSNDVFFHVVLNGMKKVYAHTDVFEATPYRDPEENIQNQLHVQLERVMTPATVIYLQYSYIKNETIFNHWFYDKNLLEAGLKLTL